MLEIPRRTILLYCKHGFITPAADPICEGYFFGDDAIRNIRRVESVRSLLRDELTAIGMVLGLLPNMT